MNLLSKQFYNQMAREFKANKNLWILVFMSSWLMVFFIASKLSLIAHYPTASLIRISLVAVSFYLAANLTNLGVSFINPKDNIAYLRYLGISKLSIQLTQCKLIFTFLMPMLLIFILSFWLTPWATNSDYSLGVYSIFFGLLLGWIFINILWQRYKYSYLFISMAIYLVVSQISSLIGILLFACGFIIWFISNYRLKLKIPHFFILKKYSNHFILIKPFLSFYLQALLGLIVYVFYLEWGDLTHFEDLLLLIILINMMITQLIQIGLTNQKHKTYTDFICLKKDSLWRFNRWIAASFFFIGAIADVIITDKTLFFIVTFLAIMLSTILLSFYLIKLNNPQSYILINAFSIILSFIAVKMFIIH